MKPAALLDQAAELLREVLRLEQPADAVVSAWFRQQRQFGARERHTLADMVHAVLRRRLLLQHLAQSGRGALERRLAILGIYGPRDFLKSALSAQEKDWVDACVAVRPEELLEPQRHNLPQWLAEPLKAQLGDGFWRWLTAWGSRHRSICASTP